MVIRNLQFFDKDGYNLNFDWNSNGYWEGYIYLPKVSVGLYSSTSIYVLEHIPAESSESDSTGICPETDFYFPTASKEGDKITFEWDSVNNFVDEFFMFNFDDTYAIQETSALVYTPNDGPDCNTLIVNRFETYDVDLDTEKKSSYLPIHIGFMANEKYDASTYNRTLIMSYNGTVIARIKFYEETVEEDERLKIWNANLGYNITPDDTQIFYKSDLKEYKPDYILLNEKRKELMLEGSNIYPYIGSYKAIINAIKFFGYDNLGIIEYWRNVNSSDENFGKIYHTSRYSLTKKETIAVGGRNISLPNADYKKVNGLSLVYSINTPTGNVDDWELPLMKEEFTYTIEEALIKLFALRKKLNKEFMPGSSRIIDVIGEGNYFGIQALAMSNATYDGHVFESDLHMDFDVNPSKYVYLTDDRYFIKYISEQENTSDIKIADISEVKLSDMSSTKTNEVSTRSIKYSDADLYTSYYNDVFVNHIRYEDYENPTDDVNAVSSAKVVLDNTTFDGMSFDNNGIYFGYDDDTTDADEITFGNVAKCGLTNITWTIAMSEDQTDDELKNVGIDKSYTAYDISQSGHSMIYSGAISTYNKILVQLPYIGYYDVTLTLGSKSYTKKKCIKVEPFNIDLIGFYYDARDLPAKIKYDMDDDMYSYVLEKLRDMTAWAVSERTNAGYTPLEFSMPTYSTDGTVINPGPYYSGNLQEEWYLADNISYSISQLLPNVDQARYIRNGVDVKPLTWILLGYEYSKIVGKINPSEKDKTGWTITNNVTGKTSHYYGKYFTCLLTAEGNYTITLTLKDYNGNTYSISRNIVVVDKTANYNLYQTFKREYDFMMEQKELAMTKALEVYSLEDDTDNLT